MAIEKVKVGGFVSDEVAKINANFTEVENNYAKKTEIPSVPTKTSELTNDSGFVTSVPTKTSDLTNDSGFQTSAQVATAIQTAIAGTGHASFERVNSVPTAATASDNVLYLVMNSATGHYDIYAKVSGEVVLIDDTTVNLSGYSTTAEMTAAINAAVANCVTAENGKGLSTNDYTTAEKTKLGNLRVPTNKTFTTATWTSNGDGQYVCTVAANNMIPVCVMRSNSGAYSCVLVDVAVSGTNIVITADESFDGYIVCV